MAGGGSRRDDGPLKIGSNNVFAALETLKKKKKSDKDKSKGSSKNQAKEPEQQVFWAPAPLTGKSWADVDDDDDYYATTAPPQSVWGSSETQQNKESSAIVEAETDSEDDGLDEVEDDGLDEVDDDAEEEPEHEAEVPAVPELVMKKPPLAAVASRETERQLSKKELKKKEMEELESVLAELGISSGDNNVGQDEINAGKKQEEQNVDGEKRENAPAPSESKSSKKKKAKKDKSPKEAKEPQEQPNGLDTNKSLDEAADEPEEDVTSAIDVKERIKKVASLKKKKSGKEMDAAAKAAAIEAAARSAKLAAAKKKEKNHYNQQPVR